MRIVARAVTPFSCICVNLTYFWCVVALSVFWGVLQSAIGIGAWNPQFDVAPASLITGIVTEVGTVVKGIGKDVFDLTGIFKE